MSVSLPVPTEPTSDLVSLREFARRVPMPEATARSWRAQGHITATRTATGRYRVPLSQLDEVRRKLGLSAPAPEATAK